MGREWHAQCILGFKSHCPTSIYSILWSREYLLVQSSNFIEISFLIICTSVKCMLSYNFANVSTSFSNIS